MRCPPEGGGTMMRPKDEVTRMHDFLRELVETTGATMDQRDELSAMADILAWALEPPSSEIPASLPSCVSQRVVIRTLKGESAR